MPISEASRFGIMNTNDDGTIYEFEEKPKKPKSTKASMGVYVFRWSVLKEYLLNDEKDAKSAHDFGKNIIPAMLFGKKKLLAYSFLDYWKDVGTVYSLWEANMDLISKDEKLKLDDAKLRVYARTSDNPPTFIYSGAECIDSMITKGCEIAGIIEDSIISSDCIVKKDAKIKKSVILPGSIIEEGAQIEYAIVGAGCIIRKGAKIGATPQDGEMPKIAVVGDGIEIERDGSILAGEMREA